jgi:hypothetical protein
MAGLGVRLFTDEMISPDLAVELRRRDYDAVSCHEVGRANQAIPDPDQLQYATDNGRAILTFNVRHFIGLDQQWRTDQRAHAGIIVSPRIADLGHLLQCVARHLDTYPPDVQNNLLLWLDTSPVQQD